VQRQAAPSTKLAARPMSRLQLKTHPSRCRAGIAQPSPRGWQSSQRKRSGYETGSTQARKKGIERERRLAQTRAERRCRRARQAKLDGSRRSQACKRKVRYACTFCVTTPSPLRRHRTMTRAQRRTPSDAWLVGSQRCSLSLATHRRRNLGIQWAGRRMTRSRPTALSPEGATGIAPPARRPSAIAGAGNSQGNSLNGGPSSLSEHPIGRKSERLRKIDRACRPAGNGRVASGWSDGTWGGWTPASPRAHGAR
jgi:hypothetical protein